MTNDESIVPVTPDPMGDATTDAPVELPGSPAELAAGWIPGSRDAPRPAAPGGSVFGKVLPSAPVASAKGAEASAEPAATPPIETYATMAPSASPSWPRQSARSSSDEPGVFERVASGTGPGTPPSNPPERPGPAAAEVATSSASPVRMTPLFKVLVAIALVALLLVLIAVLTSSR